MRRTEPELTDDEDEKQRPTKRQRMLGEGQEEAATPAVTPAAATPLPDLDVGAASSPAFSRGSSMERDMSIGPENAHKVLRIRRLVRISFFFGGGGGDILLMDFL